MHLPLIKALAAVISASVLAIGVALAPAASNTHHPHRSATPSQTTSLEADGMQEFLGQLAAGNVKPDAALKRSWIDDLSAVAHSLRLSNSELAGQLSAKRSLAQIAASRGVPASTPTAVLLRHVREDARLVEGCRGRAAGDDAGRLAWAGQFRAALEHADLAVPNCD